MSLPEKPILTIDCVVWSSSYDRTDPLFSVAGWFRKAWPGDSSELDVRHACAETLPPLSEFSGVILSGGPISVYAKEDWLRRLEDLIREAIDKDLPMLGVCLGHQLVAQAFAGEVALSPGGWEIGDPEVVLTREGREDFLFENLPSSFRVIQSHRDAVVRLPEEARLLASSPLCEVQAFALGDRVRCVQFHPEMGPEHLNFILPPRREKILKSSGIDIDEVLPRVQPTPEAKKVFENFRNRFFV